MSILNKVAVPCLHYFLKWSTSVVWLTVASEFTFRQLSFLLPHGYNVSGTRLMWWLQKNCEIAVQS